MSMGLIVQISFNNKALSGAQGDPLCKDNVAFSGRFLQSPFGRTICWRFLQEFRLEGSKPAALDFPQKSLKMWTFNPIFMFVSRP